MDGLSFIEDSGSASCFLPPLHIALPSSSGEGLFQEERSILLLLFLPKQHGSRVCQQVLLMEEKLNTEPCVFWGL